MSCDKCCLVVYFTNKFEYYYGKVAERVDCEQMSN